MNENFFENILSSVIGQVKVNLIKHVPGGDINQAIKLVTDKGNFFVKINKKNAYPGMLHCEYENLQFLKKHVHSLKIPTPISYVEDDLHQYLILEYIERGNPSKNFWEAFGKGLANMHMVSNSSYGFFYDNYMGSLYQKNNWNDHWINFFIENRILPQLQLAIQKGLVGITTAKKIEKLISLFENILTVEKPALVHGDLWGGNYFASADGSPTIFDPACYFGHREVDIAMTTLFGGFSKEFYTYYNYYFPLTKGWQERLEIYNLYPLLIHVNLFGTSYLSSVERIVNKFL